jgi:uncharacterized protein (DUF169 family)
MEVTMDISLKEKFIQLWGKYFNGAPLPIIFYYTDKEGVAQKAKPPTNHRCIIADLSRVRNGQSLSFDASSIGCGGGKRYLGFTEEMMPNFEYFLSCGIHGQLEGERYKKSPELVRKVMKMLPKFKAPGRFIIFKRWDKIDKDDSPEVVIFFEPPDVLSGLFTLSNFDEIEQNGVFSPFGAGCSTIVMYPYLEKTSSHPRGVLGMFDVSARPCVPASYLTFSAPINKFIRMIDNMDGSFLITKSWGKVKRRISKLHQ